MSGRDGKGNQKEIQENKCIKVDELMSRLTARGGEGAAGRFCPCFFLLSSNEPQQSGEHCHGGAQPRHQRRATPSSFHPSGTGEWGWPGGRRAAPTCSTGRRDPAAPRGGGKQPHAPAPA